MDLREAIEVGEKMAIWMHRMDQPHSRTDSEEAKDLILSAAKRELEREEKEKPKRMRMIEIEDELRGALWACSTDAVGEYEARIARKRAAEANAADILKVLRNTVVPWLRRKCANASYRDDDYLNLLRALGEQP